MRRAWNGEIIQRANIPAIFAPIGIALGASAATATATGVAATAAALSTAASIGTSVAGATRKAPGQAAVVPPPNPQIALDKQVQARNRSVQGLGYAESLLSGANYGGSSSYGKTQLGG